VATERRKRGPRAPGRQPKHAGRALARHIAAGTLDGRTWIAKALRDIRQDLADDAGGLDRLNARERILLDRCAAGALICMTIEHHVFASDKPITDAGELLPILRKGYVSHVQSLSRMLQALGLHPDPRDREMSLHEYLEMRSREAAAAQGSGPAAPEPEPSPDENDAATPAACSEEPS
jgi:hypothetical protein